MKHREGIEKERENLRTVFKKMFSITEDAASNEEIRDRILTGGKITGHQYGGDDLCHFDCFGGIEHQFRGGNYRGYADLTAHGQYFGNLLRNSFQ